MEINFLVRVSARMDFFFRVNGISSFVTDCFFPNNEAPECDKIGIWPCSSE